MPNFLSKIFTNGATKLVDAVGNTLDNLITNKEELAAVKLATEKEINRHIEALEDVANRQTELYLKDVADARQANVSIQGDQPSWLAKNTAHMIDLFITLMWAFLTTYILAKFMNIIQTDARADFTGILGIWAGVTALATTVLNFHRGSSQGSANKQKQLDKLMNEK